MGLHFVIDNPPSLGRSIMLRRGASAARCQDPDARGAFDRMPSRAFSCRSSGGPLPVFGYVVVAEDQEFGRLVLVLYHADIRSRYDHEALRGFEARFV